MSGSGNLKLAGQRLLPSTANLDIAGNQLQLNGSFGAPSDRLNLHVNAPQLARLGYGNSGKQVNDEQNCLSYWRNESSIDEERTRKTRGYHGSCDHCFHDANEGDRHQRTGNPLPPHG